MCLEEEEVGGMGGGVVSDEEEGVSCGGVADGGFGALVVGFLGVVVGSCVLAVGMGEGEGALEVDLGSREAWAVDWGFAVGRVGRGRRGV